MADRHETAWCTMCGARFTSAEIDGAQCCPKCHDPGLPCDPNEDVSVKVNWHELRVLAIWAENWAQQSTRDTPDEKGRARPEVVHAITRRIQRQHPGMKTPLTLSGAQIKDMGMGIEAVNVASPSIIPVNGPGAVV